MYQLLINNTPLNQKSGRQQSVTAAFFCQWFCI